MTSPPHISPPVLPPTTLPTTMPLTTQLTTRSTTQLTTQSTTDPASAAALPDVPAAAYIGQIGYWTAVAFFAAWLARKFAWRADRLPADDAVRVNGRSERRIDTLPLWVGAAVLFAVQIIFGADLLPRIAARFAGSGVADEAAMLGVTAMYLVGFAGVAIVHRFYRWRYLPSVGIGRPIGASDVRLGATGAFVAIAVTNVALLVTQLCWISIGYRHDSAHKLLQLMDRDRQSPLVLILTVLVAVVLAPAFEELLFRGHIQSAIAARFPRARWLAIVGTSLLFAGVHETWMIPPIFVLSLLLGYAYQRSRSLWVSIGMHMAFNATSTAYFLLMRQG